MPNPEASPSSHNQGDIALLASSERAPGPDTPAEVLRYADTVDYVRKASMDMGHTSVQDMVQQPNDYVDRAIDDLRNPQHSREYQSAEGFDEMYEAHLSGDKTFGDMAKEADSGVTTNPDGTVSLRWEGNNEGREMVDPQPENGGVTTDEDGNATLEWGDGSPDVEVEQPVVETPEPSQRAETENPYESYDLEKLNQIKANITDSLIKGIRSFDNDEFIRAGMNLAKIQRIIDAKSGTEPDHQRGIEGEVIYGTRMPEEVINEVAAAVAEIPDGVQIANGIGNSFEKNLNYGPDSDVEKKLDVADLNGLLGDVRRKLVELGVSGADGEYVKSDNPYDGKTNGELAQTAARLDKLITDPESSDEARDTATENMSKLRQVIERRSRYSETPADTPAEDEAFQPEPEITEDNKVSDVQEPADHEAESSLENLDEDWIRSKLRDSLALERRSVHAGAEQQRAAASLESHRLRNELRRRGLR